MPLDGLFIHNLIQEIKDYVIDSQINRIDQPSKNEVVFTIRKNHINHQLYFNYSPDAFRFHLSYQKFDNPSTPYNFCTLLRKYLNRGIIKNLVQFGNDRIICLTINSYDELGFNLVYKLYFELTGRSNNLILTTEDDIIIECSHKVTPDGNENRLIIPKAKYVKPVSNQINPFENENIFIEEAEGLCKQAKDVIKNGIALKDFINQPIDPVISSGNVKMFYTFILPQMDEITHYHDLSELLEIYYLKNTSSQNEESKYLEKVIRREINKRIKKMTNLNDDLLQAKDNLGYKENAILLQSNLYLVKPKDSQIIVDDFINGTKKTIILDPLLTPSQNLQTFFKVAQKASTALSEVSKQLKICSDEIDYLESIYYQLKFLNHIEIEQVKKELIDKNIIRINKNKNFNKKIQIPCFDLGEATILFGKNNIQNNIVTNILASKNDYWFHAKNLPGSHVIVKTDNLNETIIRFAANIAAFYSKGSSSSSVPVDYTQVRNLKKIPGLSGNNVTYTNQLTIYIDPDFNQLSQYKFYYKDYKKKGV